MGLAEQAAGMETHSAVALPPSGVSPPSGSVWRQYCVPGVQMEVPHTNGTSKKENAESALESEAEEPSSGGAAASLASARPSTDASPTSNGVTGLLVQPPSSSNTPTAEFTGRREGTKKN